ncbi:MAG: hypothetical protein E7570_02225 [Ruminococcaceae bacterium]|nr:hypothetical protein [Oscillospiraceae bacterium]
MKIITGTYENLKFACQKEFRNDYFDFCFSFVDESTKFYEINRFLYESKHTRRFVNRYEGNVTIDISEWNNKRFTNKYFDAFMYFIKDTSSYNNYIFIADKQLNSEIEKKLSEFFYINIVELESTKPDSGKTIGFVAPNEKEDKGNHVRS